jgi:DNA adenine methylase
MKKRNTDQPGPPRRLLHYTPLRYPGGKAKLAAFVKAIIEENSLSDSHYVEAYAGGAGVALELLFHEYVSHIHINDISRPVYCFWKSVLDHTDAFVRLIRNTRLSVSTWDKQKRVLANADDFCDLHVGFATFFLNRTNRSGILNGGIIGGRDQSGPWKIDARYNVEELINRIVSIAKMGRRISIYNQDALGFLKRKLPMLPDSAFIYLDPPYYIKGSKLYLDFYNHKDHERIAEFFQCSFLPQKWIISYDNVEAIHQLYEGCRHMVYELDYSARDAKKGSEVMFFCDDLVIPKPAGAMRLLA